MFRSLRQNSYNLSSPFLILSAILQVSERMHFGSRNFKARLYEDFIDARFKGSTL